MPKEQQKDQESKPPAPLPPLPPAAASLPWPRLQLKIGYGSRPAMSSKGIDDRSLRWHTNGVAPDASGWIRPQYTLSGATGLNAPKLRNAAEFNNLAIMSDEFVDGQWVTGLHRDGINVMYGNWAVKWVPYSAFKSYLANMTLNTGTGPGECTWVGSDPSSRVAWEVFDQQ